MWYKHRLFFIIPLFLTDSILAICHRRAFLALLQQKMYIKMTQCYDHDQKLLGD